MSTPLILAVWPLDLRSTSGSRSCGGATAASGVASCATTAGATDPALSSNASASAQIANADRLDMDLPPLAIPMAGIVLPVLANSSVSDGYRGVRSSCQLAVLPSPDSPHLRHLRHLRHLL